MQFLSGKMSRVKWLDETCYKCGAQMNTWDMKLTKTFKTYNICEACFCKIYDMDKDAFRDTMENYYGLRPCKGI